jgi:hypothetical protein
MARTFLYKIGMSRELIFTAQDDRRAVERTPVERRHWPAFEATGRLTSCLVQRFSFESLLDPDPTRGLDSTASGTFSVSSSGDGTTVRYP